MIKKQKKVLQFCQLIHSLALILLLILFFFALNFFSLIKNVKAQNPENITPTSTSQNNDQNITPEPGLESKTDKSSQNFDDEINTVRDTLRGQLEEYRNEEKKYIVAINQYQQLNTLTSLEEAVMSTKSLLLIRTQVLHSYFTLLRLRVINTTGIEIQEKEYVISQLEKSLSDLRNYQIYVESQNNREQINAAANQFLPIYQELTNLSLYTQMLIQAGQLQNIYDQSLVVYQQIKNEKPVEIDKLKEAEINRAFDETEQLFQSNQQKFTALWQNIKTQRQENKSWLNYNEQMNREFNSLYASLSKTLSYLKELKVNFINLGSAKTE